MEWNKSIRQTHRWLSIDFTLTVIAKFVAENAFERSRGHVGLKPHPCAVHYLNASSVRLCREQSWSPLSFAALPARRSSRLAQ